MKLLQPVNTDFSYLIVQKLLKIFKVQTQYLYRSTNTFWWFVKLRDFLNSLTFPGQENSICKFQVFPDCENHFFPPNSIKQCQTISVRTNQTGP